MSRGRVRVSGRTVPRKDGSYVIRYRGQRYAVRPRKHVETDTWDVASIWSETWQVPVPVPAAPRGDRWEALLAGELNRTVEEGLHAAEGLIEAWLSEQQSQRHPRAG